MGLSFTMQVPAQWICNSLCSMFNKNGISNGFVVYHAGTNPMDMKFVVIQFSRDRRGKSTRNGQSYYHSNAQTFCLCVCENYGLHHRKIVDSLGLKLTYASDLGGNHPKAASCSKISPCWSHHCGWNPVPI